jgi:hypothetical protein
MRLKELEAAGVPGGLEAGHDDSVARRDDLHHESGARAVVLGHDPLRVRHQNLLMHVTVGAHNLADVGPRRASSLVRNPQGL